VNRRKNAIDIAVAERLAQWQTMRAIPSLLLSVCLMAALACGRTQSKDGERINLAQNVTSDRRPQDKIFTDFENTWRQFISSSADLALPVQRPPDTAKQRWEPKVTTACVSSADAGGLVPQATFTWNEVLGPEVNGASQEQPQVETSRLRFDLSVHHDGFARNFYSSALATDKLQRFKLPPNSALINNQEAVLLTGPGMFPKLLDFNIQRIQDLVLRDLNGGLTYTIRLDRRAGSEWTEEGQFVFLTPICPV
jgi:hypothetical protein